MSTLPSINKITAILQNELPKLLPFSHHPLKREDAYTKELYCTMLAVILQCEHTPESEQIIFFKRLVEGINSEITSEQYMRQALTITDQFPQDFYNQLHENKLFKNFIVDALVMINCKEKMNAKQLLFLADLLSIFQISEKKLREWSAFSRNILLQNKEAILKYVDEYADFENLKLFAYYNIDSSYDYYLNNGDVRKIEHLMDSESEFILFENCNFTKELLVYIIHSKKLVHFKNCRFEEIPMPLQFSNLHALIFEECYFNNFDHTVMLIDSVEHIFITKCIIKNLKISTYNQATFIDVYADNKNNLMIVDCEFENILYEEDFGYAYNLIGILNNKQNMHLQRNTFKNIIGDIEVLFSENSFRKIQMDTVHQANFNRKEFIEKSTLESYVKEHLKLGENQNIQVDNKILDDNRDIIIF